MRPDRVQGEHVFTWADGATESNEIELGGGAFGTLLVPAGSGLIGKTLQFVAVSGAPTAEFSPTNLLASPKTLAAGPNHLTSDEIAQVGAVGRCKLSVDSAVSGEQKAALLWKS